MGKKRHKLTLRFTPNSWLRLQYFLRLSKTEVTGFGTVVPDLEEGFVVDEIFILKQCAGSTYATITDVDLAVFLQDFIERGRDPGTIKLWWHSHASMPLFWSGTDNSTIRVLTSGTDFLFSLVGNRTGSVLVRFDTSMPVQTVHNVRTKVTKYDELLMQQCQAELQAMLATS